jgi:predicted transcriptional regulator
MDDAPFKPTEAELEILQILWKQGPSTVRTINDLLNSERPVGYTTTLKTMQIMHEKGLLKRDDRSRSHIYSPMMKEKESKSLLLERFLKTTFGGSALKLVMHALGNHKASTEELSQIRDYLKSLDQGE